MSKILVDRRNSYRSPGHRDCGPWGQVLTFDDGSTLFDVGHQMIDAIAERTVQATDNNNATFEPGTIALTDGGEWVVAAPAGAEPLQGGQKDTVNTIIEWRGPGWYGQIQEGAYEGQHIHSYLISQDHDSRGFPTGEYAGDEDSRMVWDEPGCRGLGTPYWLDAPPVGETVNDHTMLQSI